MPSYNPDKHHRRSIRLRGYDYTQTGAYFVTICARERECLLGQIMDGIMQLSKYGRIAADSWLWLAEQYSFVDLDEWVMMPNHFHGILVISDDDRRGSSRTAPTAKRKPLGRLIGAFKTVSTKQINELRDTPGNPFWQRNYYEHIIRSERALNAIRTYIAQNPPRWELDRYNPAAIKRDPLAVKLWDLLQADDLP